MSIKLAYDVPEAAAATGFSVAFISAAIRDGRIAAKTSKQRDQDKARGGKRVILAAELDRFLASLDDA